MRRPRYFSEDLTNNLRRNITPRLGEAVEPCVRVSALWSCAKTLEWPRWYCRSESVSWEESRLSKTYMMACVNYVHGPCGVSLEPLLACIEVWIWYYGCALYVTSSIVKFFPRVLVHGTFHAGKVLVLEEASYSQPYRICWWPRVNHNLDPRFETRPPSVALICRQAPMHFVDR